MARDDTTRDKRPRPATAGRSLTREQSSHREPNTVDHYSLALQLVQVFPVVTEPIVLVLPNAWIARALAGLALIAGTAMVIRTEQHRHTRTLRQHRKPNRPGSRPRLPRDSRPRRHA